MRRNCIFLLAFALVFTFPLFAQAKHNRGTVHPGAAAPRSGTVHPGQGQHGGRISPEERMMHEWMMMQFMTGRPYTGPRTHNSASSNSGSARTPSGGGANAKSGRANQGNGSQTGATGRAQGKPNGQKAQQAKRNAKEREAERENREKSRAATNSNRSVRRAPNHSTRAVDTNAIRLLKNAHAKLREADADYAGHRMRAMEHINSAVFRLESGTGLNGGGAMGGIGSGMGGFGSGNLSQSQFDGLLRDALVHLHQTQGTLGSSATAAEHHRNAHTSIGEAIHEVEVALRTK